MTEHIQGYLRSILKRRVYSVTSVRPALSSAAANDPGSMYLNAPGASGSSGAGSINFETASATMPKNGFDSRRS